MMGTVVPVLCYLLFVTVCLLRHMVHVMCHSRQILVETTERLLKRLRARTAKEAKQVAFFTRLRIFKPRHW